MWQGKEDQKWILVDVQDPSIFDCQVLNRGIWNLSISISGENAGFGVQGIAAVDCGFVGWMRGGELNGLDRHGVSSLAFFGLRWLRHCR